MRTEVSGTIYTPIYEYELIKPKPLRGSAWFRRRRDDIMHIHSSTDISDALTKGMEEGGLVLGEEDLPSSFYDLRSGLAGELFQKFVNYQMPLALIVRDPAAYGERFNELAKEHKDHPTVRIFPDRDSASAWLAAATREE